MYYRVISADNHLIEPPDTFSARLPSRFRDRSPRIMRASDGGDGWSFDGQEPKQTFGLDAAASLNYQITKKGGLKFEELMPGHSNGQAHLEDMQLDGIDASVIFPEATVQAYVMPDRELALACMRAYNSWLVDEFCAAAPDRLLGLPVIPVDDGMDIALEFVTGALERGAKGVFIPGCPSRPYQDRYYDPLWDVLNSAGVPACLHRHRGGQAPKEVLSDHFVARTVNLYFFSIRTLSNLILTGVFDRYPNLKVVAAEVNMGWMPFWIEQMNTEYGDAKAWADMCERKPSEYVGTNVFTTVLDDYLGFRLVDEDLSHGVMYSTDYPHAAGIWPHSADLIPKLTADLKPDWTRRIVADNAIRVFQLEQQ